MRRVFLIALVILFCAAIVSAQTTTYNGIVKDLSNTPIPTGQVTFALKPGLDTTISGQGRFVPTTIFCEIHNPSVVSTSGTGTITVTIGTSQNWQIGDSIIFFGTGDATLNGSTVASPYIITGGSGTTFTFTQSGTHTNGAGGTVGGIYKSGGTGGCSVMQNSALNPAGTYYSVGLWPIFSLSTTFNTYAIGSGPVDISTIVPTPGQQPAYSFMDLFSAQTVTGVKTFSALTTFNAGVTNAGPNILKGANTIGQFDGNCIVDGVQNATLAAAVVCAGSSGVIEIPMFAVPALTANVTIPVGVTLRFDGPSGITTTGFTLTVNGPIVAPDVQIFFGTGTVTFGLNAVSSGIRSTWFPGGDGGAKINAADSSFIGTPGKILVTQNGGTTWTTAVTLTSQHALIIDCGFYATNQINVGSSGSPQNSVSISGCAAAPPYPSSSASLTTLFQSNGTNSSTAYINGSGSFILLRDLVIDGNGANNTTSAPNIFFLGSNNSVENVACRNSHTHCLQLGNGASPLRGTGTGIVDSYFNFNTGSGIFANWTTDIFLTAGVVLDNNSRYGLECVGCSGVHVEAATDVGGNTLGGILISGASTFTSGISQIVGALFKNNGGIDLDLESDSGGTAHCFGYEITGNHFNGLATGTAANTFPAIKSNGCGGSTISGNAFTKPSTAPTYSRAIQITEPTASQEIIDTIANNNCFITPPTGGAPVGNTSCYVSNTVLPTYWDGNSDLNQTISISSGFGTGASVTASRVSNGTTVFTVNVGTGGTATGGFLNMPTAPNGNGWICKINDITGAAANKTYNTLQTASGAAAVGVTNQTVGTQATVAWAASDVLQFSCSSY